MSMLPPKTNKGSFHERKIWSVYSEVRETVTRVREREEASRGRERERERDENGSKVRDFFFKK